MKINYYQSQLIGPFKAREEIMEKVAAAAALPTFKYIKHLGITTDVSNIVVINNQEIEIGKTGIYEIGNTKVTSLYFTTDVNKNTIIDYTIE